MLQLCMYEPRTSRGRALNIRLCDTMGLEDFDGLNVKDVPSILDGHVKDGFEVTFIQYAPTLKDCSKCKQSVVA